MRPSSGSPRRITWCIWRTCQKGSERRRITGGKEAAFFVPANCEKSRFRKNPGSGKIPVQEKSRFRKNPDSGKIVNQEKSALQIPLKTTGNRMRQRFFPFRINHLPGFSGDFTRYRKPDRTTGL